MLCPTLPSSHTTSVNANGDSATVPLAVVCGTGSGTRTLRTRTERIFGLFIEAFTQAAEYRRRGECSTCEPPHPLRFAAF
jgi:hypothetical protein